MKDADKLFLFAVGLSWIVSFIFFLVLATPLRASFPGDIEKILIANLQLDGVLFGFATALFAFLFKRLAGQNSKMSVAYATTAFISFFFSVLFSFIVLFNPEEAAFILKLLPICFTLTGIITTIAFLVDASSRTLKQKGVKQYE